MANEQTGGAVAEAAPYIFNVEDAGPATKKVRVEIPAERIAAKLTETMKDLRIKAAIPGFRVGHAPAKLIEKKFGTELKEDVRRSLISESFEEVVDKHSLSVIGEPEFENPEGIKLPDAGALVYSFTVEVQPNFDLPELKGIKVKKPKVEVTDENINQAMQNLREQQGTLVPVEGRGVEAKDYLVADVHLKCEGAELAHAHDAQIVSRPGRVGDVMVEDLDKQLEGLKVGEKRTISVQVPDTHSNEKIKGKTVEIEVALKDIKKLELAEINQAFLEDLGFDKESELRDALKEQMLERIDFDVKQTMRGQVAKHLSDAVNFEVPSKLSARQTQRVIQRRQLELLQRGMSADQVRAATEAITTGAAEEAGREMKMFFILNKVAEKLEIDVQEPELNGRIAEIAIMREVRPEKLKQEMSRDGSLQNLYQQMREQKALDAIIADAQVEEVSVESLKEEAKKA